MKTPCLLIVALSSFALSSPGAVAAMPEVSLILVDGDMREDWPDRGVIAFHRTDTTTPLIVNFSVSGTANASTDYSSTATTTLAIPAGDQEAWLEFAPTGQPLGVDAKTIIVTLQPGPGYVVSAVAAAQTATITLGNASPQPSAKAAVRFLQQAAFGPNGDFRNVREVMKKGYENWLRDQFTRPVGLQQPYLDHLKRLRHGKVYAEAKAISWWNRAMDDSGKSDPLRQRIGFALSEIFVISDHLEELGNEPSGMLNYYDVLLKGAFGNYRVLLFIVGTHPCMGIYLNHLGNEKGDPAAGTFADENFAREIMQLFSIGLWELNIDGTQKLDATGQPIPTYDNSTIAHMARVMTGFSFGGPKAKEFFYPPENFNAPMRMWDEFHDLGEKTLLNGVQLPGRTASDPDTGTAGMADFNAAIDCLFHHPNTAPFICKQLIQKLVTSNPSPAYVARVAEKFVNNGSGVRGDLQAVVRAILMDSEARNLPVGSITAGKLKEPYLQTVNLARAFNAKAGNGIYALKYLEDVHFQQPLSAPSVFNFFKPGYAPAGPIAESGLVAPEFQIMNAVTALRLPNYYLSALRNGFNRWGSDNRKEIVRPHFDAELALVEDVPALLRRLDLLLTAGTLSAEQHEVIREALEKIDSSMWQWKLERVRMAVYLIVSSPEFGILR
jgi:uncharacterized protein (DUF1800 family)